MTRVKILALKKVRARGVIFWGRFSCMWLTRSALGEHHCTGVRKAGLAEGKIVLWCSSTEVPANPPGNSRDEAALLRCLALSKEGNPLSPTLTSLQIDAGYFQGRGYNLEWGNNVYQRAVPGEGLSYKPSAGSTLGSREGMCLGPEAGVQAAHTIFAPWEQLPTQFYLVKFLIQICKGKSLIEPALGPFLQRHSPSPESVWFFQKPAESTSGPPWAKRLT